MTEPAVRAGIYCRMSLAADEDTTKVADQERICRELAMRLGWETHDVYQDNNRSAWKHDRKRPAWDRMLADIEAGKISAIVVYHGDRLTRQPMDLEILIALSRTRGIRLASPTGVRDLNNDDDQFTLGIEANVYRKESASTSRRRKAQYERWRREGKVRPGGRGGRAFGFARDGITHVPGEAGIIRAAAMRVLAGHSVGSIAADLRRGGVLTTAGLPMSHNTLRRVLASPRVAGLMPDGEHQAAWEPVLDRGTWEMTRAVLMANQANPRAGNGALHLLSGIAVCGLCGRPLNAGHNGTRAGVVAYKCPPPGCGKVARNAELLDAYVTGAVTGRLNHPGNPAAEVQLNDGAAAELAALTARRAETEAFIASLADAPARRIEVLNRALDSFDAKIEAIRGQMAGAPAGRLRAQYAGITRAEFGGLPLEVRRALVRACYTVTVLPASRRGPGFRTEDVILAPPVLPPEDRSR